MQVIQTETFLNALRSFADRNAKARVVIAVRRMAEGNLGDWKPVGEGVLEARIHYGPGYRIYFVRRGIMLIVLLLCGDKASQDRDSRLAKLLAKTI